MTKEDPKQSSDNFIFALDIGTRSIMGIVGALAEDKVDVIAMEREEHAQRAMVDGQIEDIDQVARLARLVKERLEKKLGIQLRRVCVAAAGRTLKTQKASYEMELPTVQRINQELVSRLEAGAISQAEAAFTQEDGQDRHPFFLVGYSVQQYYLDNYNISSLLDHQGKSLKADVIATFLPSQVVDSLYAAMGKSGLEVASLTLEPIAAINAAIPQDLRLLNLALVDIGAGTSDIAVCRDGCIFGYTMATLAGDEITETLMREYLVDFATGEQIKFAMAEKGQISFTDILGFPQAISQEEALESIREPLHSLCREIAKQVMEVNGGPPSAVFLAGGGSRLTGMREAIAQHLNMDLKRVALAGNHFHVHVKSEGYDLNNPEFATPLGILVSAGLNLINDSFCITLNGKAARLFRSGALTIMDILMMNGYGYQNLMGRSGQNITLHVDGKRKVIYGERPTPAILKRNGKEAKVTDIVQAGDSIQFLPAVHGKDASALVADVVSQDSVKVAVNGVISTMDHALATGDVIITMSSPGHGGQPAKEEPSMAGDSLGDPLESAGPASHKAQAVMADEEAQGKSHSHGQTLDISLNGSTLRLPPKLRGEPYYLMDILEYSGLDFEHATGPVTMKINGADGAFLQELKNHDQVVIACQDRAHFHEVKSF